MVICKKAEGSNCASGKKMDGLSFCEYINGLGRNIKIIIISAYSKFEYAKKGIQLGVYDFLEKPVDYDFLSSRIVQAGKDKHHEEQVFRVYENNHGSDDYADKELSDYTRFDYFEKKLADSLSSGDFDGIDETCTQMRIYMENHRIKRSYVLFFVTNFFGTRICSLLPEEKTENLISLSKINEMGCAPDILAYFQDVLLASCREIRNHAGNDTEHTVTKIKRYIEENYCIGDLSLGQIAREFNMSPNYISRIFREQTGSTLVNYINSLRILKAKKLLVETDKKIGEISNELGYSSQYYFSMGFKKATGYSPKEYRKIKR